MDNNRTYNNEDLKTVASHAERDSRQGEQNIDEAVNGSMAPDLDEMKELGQDMDKMKTNRTLKEQGLVSDPQQDEADGKPKR